MFRRFATPNPRRTPFTFSEADHENLSDGPTQASIEGQRSLLDHRWVIMAAVVMVIGAFLRSAALLAIPGFMLTAVIFSWLWSRTVLDGLEYKRVYRYTRAFPGETVEAQITVENAKLLPLTWLQVEDEWPAAFGPADDSILSPGIDLGAGFLVNVYSLHWYERIRRHYLLMARSRGHYVVGPAHLISGDPFSLFEEGRRIDSRDHLIVYPEIKPLAELGLNVSDPFGDQGVPQRLFEDPTRVVGVRDYQQGDGFRHVHWKATARTGTLQVKQYEPTRALSIALCLNVASFEQHWQGTWPELIEHLISVAASLADWALAHRYAVGILANAPFGQADQSVRAQPSRSRDQLMRLLEALAGISYFVTQEFSRFLLAESRRLPWGTTLVLLTGFVTDPMINAIGQIQNGGRRVALISVGQTLPPQMPGVATFYIPLPDAKPPESARPVTLR